MKTHEDEDEELDDFHEMIKSMEFIADYDGEKVMNSVLDHYHDLIKENPRNKKKIHKFLTSNEELREITVQQKKIIEYCKSHKKIYPREVEKLLELNLEKEEIILKIIKLFPNHKIESAALKRRSIKSKKNQSDTTK
jgi:DNA-directed RNA polymerase subunit F